MDPTWLVVIGEGLIIGLILFLIRGYSTLRMDNIAQHVWQEQHDKRDEDRFSFHQERIREVHILLAARPTIVPAMLPTTLQIVDKEG